MRTLTPRPPLPDGGRGGDLPTPDTLLPTPDLEVERYELREMPAGPFTLTRRSLFRALGGGIAVLLFLPRESTGQESGGQRRGGRGGFGGGQASQDLAAWIHIGEDGKVTAFCGKAEVGQNARTSLTQAVAEELRIPVSSIEMVLGDTALCPYDMGTFGSRTTPATWPIMRRAGAAAREMLLDLAAEQLKADRSGLKVADGKVVDSAGKSMGFGQITQGRKLTRTITEDVPVAAATDWKVAGHAIAKVNAREIVTGGHRYSSDIKRPGMMFGKIVRPAGLNSTLEAVNTSATEAMAGVKVVRQGDFIGIVAPDPFIAQQGAEAVNATWKTPPQPSSAELFDYLRKNPEEQRGGFGGGGIQRGSMDAGLAATDHKLAATYTISYIAHTPLEPRAAVAEWEGDHLTVWTGTQRPFGVRPELAQAFNIPEEKVRVIVPDTGSGYGGKHTGECAVEAARLAKAVGKPVKIVWTREEEFQWAYFRPAGVVEISSGVAKDGTITAWEFHNYNSGGAGIGTPYNIANQRIQFHATKSPLRQGSYRALASTANHFARESHMDELAHTIGMDPLSFRMKNLTDERVRAVLSAATDRFGWGKAKPTAGHAFGLACGTEKGGYVATCADVTLDKTGKPRVVRTVTAFECGAIVNPDHLKNQVEGAINMGIGGALFEAIQFENGRVTNGRLSKYRVPRFGDAPAQEVILIDRKDLPSAGAGECPIVCLAPAVGNALFALTGERRRGLPMGT